MRINSGQFAAPTLHQKQWRFFVPRMQISRLFLGVSAVLGAECIYAAGVPTLDVIEVEGGSEELIGAADSANQGTVLKKQIEARTVYRPGEIIETTPGLIMTQHSGEGKAGQYFLRGFNLDHGTDLLTTVDGMIVNQRSHGHGQGWTDLNFLIPELVSDLQYKKGPYYAEEGDFSTAGAVHVNYLSKLPKSIISAGVGEGGYRRIFAADSVTSGKGDTLYALELFHNDGPFRNPDDYRKINGVMRYSQGDAANGFNFTAMAYRGRWNATDQIPQRAVDSGLLSSRLDAIDPSDGGSAYRYSLSGAWQQTQNNTITKANAYVIRHDLKIFSNFTYFLDDPVNGDQFAQPGQRTMAAANASKTWLSQWQQRDMENTFGVQLQRDNISNALLKTKERQTLSTVRDDDIVESSMAVYAQNSTQWFEKFRTVAGLRSDFYRFDVQSDNSANTGEATDSITNPKLSMIFGPWNKTEYYVNMGGGFHSNDARGTTISIDPQTGLSAERVMPLVRTKGYEAGVRTALIPHVQTTFTVYRLDIDSELLFLGDAGTTEAGRASRREGFEFANFYSPAPWLTMDLDIAYARARFTEDDPAGDKIPGAVEGVASLGAAVDNLGAYFGGLHLRYFGPRPLIEDNSVRSSSTTGVNGEIGYKLDKAWRVVLEGFNLLDKPGNAIEYFYASRLPNESAEGVEEKHFHPIESRTFRLNIVGNF